jgi:DNA-binding NtrC family response regulator
MTAPRILIIDDEAAIRFGMRDFLVSHGYDVDEADTCRSAEEVFRAARPDAVIVDYLLPDGNALDLLPRLKAIDAEAPLIILTGHGSIDLAVRAVKEGAEQFLTKPTDLSALLVVLERLLEQQRTRQKQRAGATRQTRTAVDPFLGTSTAIRQLADEARQVVGTESPILIQGETGTGKGVLAKWLHEHGPRANEPFVDLNCAGLSREFLDTELFGHEKGAFTGAASAKSGLLEVAHRGTVFLDEIGDMDVQVQPKLLKVLEEKRFRRLGSVTDRRVDVRLMSATHQDLGCLVTEQRFRSDLYFRLNTIPLVVPPLRARREDIAVLTSYLLQRIAVDLGRPAVEPSAAAVDALTNYSWPGNIRELRNVLERAVLLGGNQPLDSRHLRFTIEASTEAAPGDTSLTLLEVERRHIERVLAEEGGQVAAAAQRLRIPKSSLYQKIKKLDIARIARRS